jgi:methylmalonyl-CoA carboxyltransferase small subunit
MVLHEELAVKVQMLIGADVYEVEIERSSSEIAGRLSRGLSAWVKDQSVVPDLPAQRQPASLAEMKLCRSPLAGIVARVNIAAGQQAQPGDVMIVLEAMKMETNITASAPLKAKSVKVMPGDVVKPDQILLEFE